MNAKRLPLQAEQNLLGRTDVVASTKGKGNTGDLQHYCCPSPRHWRGLQCRQLLCTQKKGEKMEKKWKKAAPPPPSHPSHLRAGACTRASGALPLTTAQPRHTAHRHPSPPAAARPRCWKLGSARKEKKQRAKHAGMTHRGPYQTEKVCSYPPS